VDKNDFDINFDCDWLNKFLWTVVCWIENNRTVGFGFVVYERLRLKDCFRLKF